MAEKHSAQASQTTRMRLPQTWQMLGLHGQVVGKVESCGIDMHTGRIKYLVLETPWQTLTIPWQTVCVESSQGRFQLRGKHRQIRSKGAQGSSS